MQTNKCILYSNCKGAKDIYVSSLSELIQDPNASVAAPKEYCLVPTDALQRPKLATCASDAVQLWHIADGTLLYTPDSKSTTSGVAFSPGGTILSSGVGNGLKLWRVADGILLRTLERHTDNVLNVALSPDGLLLASASADGTIRLWGVLSEQEP